MDNVNLERIAAALEALAGQATPWMRVRISAPPVFTDRHGDLIAIAMNLGNAFAITGKRGSRERPLFAGTWPQCRRHLDRLFIEDVTARAVAAAAEAPTEPAITWRPGGGYISGFVHDAEFGEVRQYVRYSESCSVRVLGGTHNHRIADCVSEAAAKALCERWERAFIEATKEVQS